MIYTPDSTTSEEVLSGGLAINYLTDTPNNESHLIHSMCYRVHL